MMNWCKNIFEAKIKENVVMPGVTAYLGLGSNLGDKRDNLNRATELLRCTTGITVKHTSPFYETSPVGYIDQPDFLNAAVEINTVLDPDRLLEVCQGIEKELKRVNIVRWGPRTIDIDILLYGDLVIRNDRIVLPHPRMHEREFVLRPLNDIAPQAVHPVYNMTVEQLCQRVAG